LKNGGMYREIMVPKKGKLTLFTNFLSNANFCSWQWAYFASLCLPLMVD